MKTAARNIQRAKRRQRVPTSKDFALPIAVLFGVFMIAGLVGIAAHNHMEVPQSEVATLQGGSYNENLAYSIDCGPPFRPKRGEQIEQENSFLDSATAQALAEWCVHGDPTGLISGSLDEYRNILIGVMVAAVLGAALWEWIVFLKWKQLAGRPTGSRA